MTGEKMVLSVVAQSTEGIHDFIPLLENIVEEIKGGSESGTEQTKSAHVSWSITPKP